MVTMYDLRQKEIINIKDGSRYGFVADIVIDEEKGTISKLIVPGPGKILGVFGREQEYQIEWEDVKQIGEDLILVEVETLKVLKELD